jgi:hypothetical protein
MNRGRNYIDQGDSLNSSTVFIHCNTKLLSFNIELLPLIAGIRTLGSFEQMTTDFVSVWSFVLVVSFSGTN